MQSLGPARGQVRRKGSADALLARGIAAPRKSSRGLPVLPSARRLVTRSPRSVRLGRLNGDRVRGKWLIVCALFLVSALVYGAWIGGQTERLFDALNCGVEKLAVAAGFGVKRITVEGQSHATDAEITAALKAGPDTMMLGFDTDAAKARLEMVPWIRHAQVMRLLPSTLQVQIEERVPYAIWQNHGQTYVVDVEGGGATLIVALSNDSWIAEGARLNFAASAFLSIETRRPQVRATTTGISAIVDSQGGLFGYARFHVEPDGKLNAWEFTIENGQSFEFRRRQP